MSSSNNAESAVVETTTSAPGASAHQEVSTPSKPVEMSETHGGVVGSTATAHDQTTEHMARGTSSSERPRTPRGPARTDTTTALQQALAAPETPPASTDFTPNRKRAQSTAIGPATENIAPISKEEEASGPRLDITLLLTNGARHPFILDAKYMTKRNVDVQADDPFNLSVYKLKELILREWRDEWEQKPTSPSYIRLISFGKLLDDKSALKDLKFNRTDRNVVHMTIKPQDFIDEDDGKGAKAAFSSGRAGDENRSPGCRCVIM